MHTARLTISKPSYGNGDEYIELRVRDDTSGTNVLALKLTLDNFTRTITGLGEVKAEVDRFISPEHFEQLGKEKEVNQVPVIIEGKSVYDVRKMIQDDSSIIDSFIPDGWKLWNNGMSSKQEGKHYMITVCRYV